MKTWTVGPYTSQNNEEMSGLSEKFQCENSKN